MTTIQIKKDGQDPQVINVPEGAKIIIEDGVTIVESVFKDGKQWNPDTKQIEELKYIPKDGDCVEFDYIGGNHKKKGYFVAKIIDGKIFDSGNWLAINHTEIHKKSSIDYDVETFSFRKITPEELQSKFNELGYEYNFETHTAKKLRWKPKVNEVYYVPAPDQKFLYYRGINNICEFDTYRINKNLAFKTPEEAIEVAKRWLQQL